MPSIPRICASANTWVDARADACVEGTSEVDLTVGAQESVANPGFRPGREGNKRVEVGVEGAA